MDMFAIRICMSGGSKHWSFDVSFRNIGVLICHCPTPNPRGCAEATVGSGSESTGASSSVVFPGSQKRKKAHLVNTHHMPPPRQRSKARTEHDYLKFICNLYSSNGRQKGSTGCAGRRGGQWTNVRRCRCQLRCACCCSGLCGCWQAQNRGQHYGGGFIFLHFTNNKF